MCSDIGSAVDKGDVIEGNSQMNGPCVALLTIHILSSVVLDRKLYLPKVALLNHYRFSRTPI